MDARRAALKRQAREVKPEAGVYQIRNLRDGRILVESTLNLKSLNGRRIELARGVHRNARLQADLRALGAEAFVFEVLEVLRVEEELLYPRDALERLEAAWLERLRPWGARGYNAEPCPAGPPLAERVRPDDPKPA
jgi:hypothetical protein